MKKRTYKVYFATEENGYEMCVEEFDNLKNAQHYYNGIEIDLDNDDEDYETYLYLCTNKRDCARKEREIKNARKNFIAITLFGCEYEFLNSACKAEVRDNL